MNIREELLRSHSKENAMKIAAYACSSPRRFKELMQCFLENNYRVAQRAAWSVRWAARKKSAMVIPYVKELAAQLQRTDVHDAVIRNSVRILQEIDIPEVFHGEVMSSCFALIETHTTPSAIKAFALTTLFRLSAGYPDIIPEIKLIIRERGEHESAAFRSRGKKILDALERTGK